MATLTISQIATVLGATAGGSKEYTGSLPIPLTETAVKNTTTTVFVGIDVSAVKALLMVATRDLTVTPYNGASAGTPIELVANVPYVWTTDSYDSFLLAADVTKFTLANADVDNDATFSLSAVVDATP